MAKHIATATSHAKADLKGIRTNPTAIAQYERQAKALELRKAGWVYEKIATELGYYNAMSACRSIQACLRRMCKDDVEDVKIIELERLDRLHKAVWQQALGFEEVLMPVAQAVDEGLVPADTPLDTPVKILRPITIEDQARAIEKCIRIMERRSRLLGLDAPTKVDVLEKRAVEEFKTKVIQVFAKVSKEFPDAGRAILRELKNAGVV